MSSVPVAGVVGESAPMVIRYCDKCGVRISQSDIDTGNARLLDETRALCPSCKAPIPGRASGQSVVRAGPTREVGVRAALSSRRDSGRRLASADTQPVSSQYRSTGSSFKPLLIIGGVVGAIILLAILALIAGVGSGPPARAKASDESKPPETTGLAQTSATKPEIPDGTAVTPAAGKADTTAATKDKTDYDPRAGVADSLLAGAKDYLEKNPEDPWGYKERLEALCQGYARTPAAEEATRLLAAWKEPPPDQPLTGLAACWTFDEGSGTTVGDASGQRQNDRV